MLDFIVTIVASPGVQLQLNGIEGEARRDVSLPTFYLLFCSSKSLGFELSGISFGGIKLGAAGSSSPLSIPVYS